MARVDHNTTYGDRTITRLVLCDRNTMRCPGEGGDYIEFGWIQNSDYIEGSSAQNFNEPGLKTEFITLIVRDDPGPIAGPDVPLDGNGNLLDPASFAARVTPGTGGPDAAGFDPMVIGQPAHPYRFELW